MPQDHLILNPNQGAPGLGLGELGGPGQLMSSSQTEAIEVVNPVTGKLTTIAQDRMIEWARQQEMDQT